MFESTLPDAQLRRVCLELAHGDIGGPKPFRRAGSQGMSGCPPPLSPTLLVSVKGIIRFRFIPQPADSPRTSKLRPLSRSRLCARLGERLSLALTSGEAPVLALAAQVGPCISGENVLIEGSYIGGPCHLRQTNMFEEPF